MEYYAREIRADEGIKNTAGTKARDDAEQIFEEMGMKALVIPSKYEERNNASGMEKLAWHKKIMKIWEEALKDLKSGDTLYIQFPLMEHSIYMTSFVQKLKKKNIRIVLLIHDLELLRVAKRTDVSKMKKIRLKIEEQKMLLISSVVIVHNEKMKEYVKSLGKAENEIVSLEIFDYLIPDLDEKRLDERELGKDKPVIIAGTLRQHKAQYAYKLPDQTPFNLFGVGYTGVTNEYVHYLGAFPPDELPYDMYGSVGLVWDGTEADTCSGVYGEYLKINNPHKTSLYLASQIPLAIWDQAALADFITANKCGITVSSLAEIRTKLENMTEEEYQTMRENTRVVSKRLTSGYYTKKAILQCRQK